MPSSLDDPGINEWYEAGIAAFEVGRLLDVVDEKARGFSDEYWEQPFGI